MGVTLRDEIEDVIDFYDDLSMELLDISNALRDDDIDYEEAFDRTMRLRISNDGTGGFLYNEENKMTPGNQKFANKLYALHSNWYNALNAIRRSRTKDTTMDALKRIMAATVQIRLLVDDYDSYDDSIG